MKGWE
jgi:elongator complex protein 1